MIREIDRRELEALERSIEDLRRSLEKLKRIDLAMAPHCDALLDELYDFLEKTRLLTLGEE